MMSSKTRLYKCPVCDTVVELLEECGLELTCCGPAMIALVEKTEPVSSEHQITAAWVDGGIVVRVGSPIHVMDEDHRISWIEVQTGRKMYRQFLQNGDSAEIHFPLQCRDVIIRAYCTVHGLWKVTSAPVEQRLGIAVHASAAAQG